MNRIESSKYLQAHVWLYDHDWARPPIGAGVCVVGLENPVKCQESKHPEDPRGWKHQLKQGLPTTMGTSPGLNFPLYSMSPCLFSFKYANYFYFNQIHLCHLYDVLLSLPQNDPQLTMLGTGSAMGIVQGRDSCQRPWWLQVDLGIPWFCTMDHTWINTVWDDITWYNMVSHGIIWYNIVQLSTINGGSFQVVSVRFDCILLRTIPGNLEELAAHNVPEILARTDRS